jgi:hypothetical protein
LISPRSLPTSPCELSEREVTSPSNLKVVGALDNYSLTPKTNVMKKSFAYSSAVLWNKLSTNVKTSTTLSMFKTKCFKYLKETSD